ncbi:MAG TPA: M23 family metallopeptidase [Acidimicrobiales bacterium]|nr:M23 family metallopeptidase [Acidimicrobiales bacterium]
MAIVVTVLVAGVGGAWASTGGSTGPPVTLPGPTTTAGPTTTINTHTTVSPGRAPTTVAPASTSTTVGSAAGPGQVSGVSPDAGTSPTAGPQVIPGWAAYVIAHSPRSAPNNSGGLLLALQPLVDIGLTPVQAAVVGMGRFPVAGYAKWQDDFLDPRFNADGTFHFHGGNDLVAGCGTLLRSPTDGTLLIGSDPAGGLTVEVVQADKTYFYLAHLSAWVAGQVTGQSVRVGDVIGFVGSTGSATGCHLHLEIHPQGGPAVDPKPYVDAWVADAIAQAPALIDRLRVDRGLAALHPAAPAAAAPPVAPPPLPAASGRDTLLWASSANPAGGALALAQADAADAVDSAGVAVVTIGARDQAYAWTQAEVTSAAALATSTPAGLRPLLGMGTG